MFIECMLYVRQCCESFICSIALTSCNSFLKKRYFCYCCYLYPLRIWLLEIDVPKIQQKIRGFLIVKQEVRRQAMIGFGLAALEFSPQVSAMLLSFPL